MRFLLWIWCFPQMLLGLCVKIYFRAEHRGDHYAFSSPHGSVSLGEYVFLCPAHQKDPITLRHELGHRTQSRMLGWLYLPIIGLPSFVWCRCFGDYRKKHRISYYSFYTERWADRLAGICR